MTGSDNQFNNPQHPITADHRWLWFDAVNEQLPGQQRRGLWRKNLISTEVQRMTTDPYGSSYDREPIPSWFNPGVIYLSNRSGLPKLKFSCDGTQASGLGEDVYSGDAVAAWSRNVAGEHMAFVARRSSSTNFYRYHVSCSEIQLEDIFTWNVEGDLALGSERLAVSTDGNKLLISTTGSGIYLKELPTGNTIQIIPSGREACFSPDDSQIAFVDIPVGETDHELYVTDLGANGAISNLRRVTYNNREDRHPTWHLVVSSTCAGDFDLEGDVDGIDLVYLLNGYAKGSLEADLNGDGSVDLEDIQLFSENFGKNDCF